MLSRCTLPVFAQVFTLCLCAWLQMNPLVSSLALYDIAGTPGVGADVSHINTKAQVKVRKHNGFGVDIWCWWDLVRVVHLADGSFLSCRVMMAMLAWLRPCAERTSWSSQLAFLASLA